MFMMGGCGLAYEYTFSKLSSDLLGNTVRQWAIIIAIMLFAMGIGADWQKRLSSEHLVDKLIGSQLLLAIIGSFSPILLLYAYSAIPYHFFFLLYSVAFLIGVLIGFEIPLLTRINETNEQEIRLNIAHILKMDYIGALCGALLWVFVLSLFFGFGQVGFIVGGLTLMTVGFTIIVFYKDIRFPKEWMGISLLVLGLSIYGFIRSGDWTLNSEQRMYQDRVVFSETTPYQHIVITQSPSGDNRCYINGNLQFNSIDEYIYHENLVHPVMHAAKRHQRVLVLGGGDGLAVREILKYKDVKEIILVDIDPMMTHLAMENPLFVALNGGSLSDERTRLVANHASIESGNWELSVQRKTLRDQRVEQGVASLKILNMDAAKYVEQAPGLFDIIIIDFPDPSSPDLAKLHSKLFYTHVRKKLTAEGLFAVQATSPIHAKETYLCIGRTIHSAGMSAIPYHDNVPSFGEWGWWLGGNTTLNSTERLKAQIEEIKTFSVETRYLTPALVKGSLVFGKNQLLSINSDISTITGSQVYKYYLKAWKQPL